MESVGRRSNGKASAFGQFGGFEIILVSGATIAYCISNCIPTVVPYV